MPARLPAIVPGARFDEVAGPADGFCGVDEVGSWGEELVGEGEDAGGQRGGDEICGFVSRLFQGKLVYAGLWTEKRKEVKTFWGREEGALPMHVVPKVLSMWSGEIES